MEIGFHSLRLSDMADKTFLKLICDKSPDDYIEVYANSDKGFVYMDLNNPMFSGVTDDLDVFATIVIGKEKALELADFLKGAFDAEE